MLQSRISQVVIALLLGALMPLSFAPFSFTLIAPIALGLLLLLIQQKSPKRSFLLGLSFGFGMFAWGIWWVRISLLEFGGAPLPFGILLTLLLALYLALYYGVLAYLMAKIKGCLYIRIGLIFPVLGVVLELIRSELLTGFPWLALGYSLTELKLASLIFPEMGALMASFWIYWFAGIIAIVLMFLGKKIQKRRSAQAQTEVGKASFKQFLLELAPSLIAFVVMFGVMLGTMTFVKDDVVKAGDPLKVALLQGNIAQELKFSEAQYFDILATYMALTEEVADESDLIIWPETAIPSLYELELNLGNHIRTLSQNEETTIMTGIFSGNGSTVRNSVVTFSDSVRARDQRYDKVHLVPFGEFIPFRSILNLFSGLIAIPYSDLTPGAEAQSPFVISSKKGKDQRQDFRASAFICYEAVFGDELRYQGRESQFLVNVSNDAWFGDSIGPWQHFQISRARAIELQREVVRSTNNGITALISQNGQVVESLPQFEKGALVVDVTPYDGATTYAKLGDLFWLGISLVLLLIGVALNFWQGRRD